MMGSGVVEGDLRGGEVEAEVLDFTGRELDTAERAKALDGLVRGGFLLMSVELRDFGPGTFANIAEVKGDVQRGRISGASVGKLEVFVAELGVAEAVPERVEGYALEIEVGIALGD